ncbi:MAG: hypothetical protein TR69_WS6001000432 [candidate division WS6 bacterium OLB20]|uniref:Uncharacterized protein n=1 Tax=candidate division WS6 bacterium OLB20 TaxID=1617426 RepID=A0A136LXQ4_9BACT|nr:MAG: hypothetical protein TR69_WS6001000432 [candidate division WS6 bacterium OLB20]
MQRIFLLITGLTAIIILPVLVQASVPSSLTITELMPNPDGSDTTGEWIELLVSADSPVNLSDWSLNGMPLPDIDIEPGFVILARNAGFVRTLVPAQVPVLEHQFSLPNGGGTVSLSGANEDAFTYPQSHEGRSFELLTGECRLIAEHQTGTPGEHNSACVTPSTTVQIPSTSSDFILYISALLPYPKSGDEWTEITNLGPDQADLSGWFLRDASGRQTPLHGTAAAGEIRRINGGGITLNNDGDTIYLVSPEGMVTDVVSYSASIMGVAITTGSVSAHEEPLHKETTALETEFQGKPQQDSNSAASVYRIPRFYPSGK